MLRLTYFVAVLCLVSVAPAQSFDWAAGAVGRVVVPGTSIGLLARTEEAGKVLARIGDITENGEVDTSRLNAARYAKDVVKVPAGTRVGIVGKWNAAPEHALYDWYYAKVKVQNGPLKGGVFYTPYVYMTGYFVPGEPVVICAASKAAGAFDDYNLKKFYEALNEGDDATVDAYLAIRQVIALPRGTRGVVTRETSLDHPDKVRMQITSGKATGSSSTCFRDS